MESDGILCTVQPVLKNRKERGKSEKVTEVNIKCTQL